jgi:uncharacterized integral membrane protein
MAQILTSKEQLILAILLALIMGGGMVQLMRTTRINQPQEITKH